MTNLLRDYNLVSNNKMSKNEFKKKKSNPMTADEEMKNTLYKNSEILQQIKFEELRLRDKYSHK